MKKHAPSAERNQGPILEVLKDWMADCRSVLEVASGTGQHIFHFAPHFPQIEFQPTEIDLENLSSIRAWKAECPTENVKDPFHLNVLERASWEGLLPYDLILNFNMIHISPWEATLGLLDCAYLLTHGRQPGGLILYGPFRRKGVELVQSNKEFESWLKEKDPRFGIRELETLEEEALKRKLLLQDAQEMPANNLLVRFIQKG